MKEKIKTYSSYSAPAGSAGFVCVGFGNLESNLTEVLGIDMSDLYQACGSNNWNGNDSDSLYFVKQEVWNKIFTPMSYADIQKTLVEYMGLKVGDKVKITHKVSSHYLGWSNSWVSTMDDFIGKTVEVRDIDTHEISIVGSTFGFPITCMEKVKFEPITLKLTDDYDALIQEDGSVKVGCQTIPFDVLEKVYLAAKEQV